MALEIHSLDRTGSHVSHAWAAPAANAASPTAQTTSQPQSAAAPSFSAVFAQIAAAAAAAGTTEASVAPAAGGTVSPAPATNQAASSAPAASAASAPSSPAANATSAPAETTDSGSDPAGPLFGPNPWLSDPTGNGPDGNVTHYNPVYFATQQTAQTVAQMLGGTVVQSNQITTAPGSPFQQNQPNYMVQLANGGQVNPGFIADIYTHGWNQSFINQQVANEVAGAAPASIKT